MTPRNTLHRAWGRLSAWPLGKYVFSFITGVYIPYTGSMSAKVDALEPGYARVRLSDRRKVRNHMHAVHAIALANLAEFTGNLALVCGLPDNARFTVLGLSIDYIKKARGSLIAECRTIIVSSNERQEVPIEVLIRDRQQDLVAKAVIRSLVGPKKTGTGT